MNYLSHYVYNHEISGIAPQPYFVMGVAIPDLWSRYTRARRIRWKAVQSAEPQDETDEQLRAGLLNHIAIDRAFHCLPAFLGMQRELKTRFARRGIHAALLEFLCHVSVELALDSALLVRRPTLADEFYDRLAACDAREVERRVARLGAVNTDRLAEAIDGFIARRFLRAYMHLDGLVEALRLILSRTSAQGAVSPLLLSELIRGAAQTADPDAIWAGMPHAAATQTSATDCFAPDAAAAAPPPAPPPADGSAAPV